MLSITGSLGEFNLARVILAGLMADKRLRERHGREFVWGATALVHSLLKLSTYRLGVTMTPGDALDVAYMSVVGAVGLGADRATIDEVPSWLLAILRRLLEPAQRGDMDGATTMTSLLLIAVYETESGHALAPNFREALATALALTASETDEFHRRRYALAWLRAGRAAIASGDEALARSIAQVIAKEVLESREALSDRRPWADVETTFMDDFGEVDGLYRPIFELPMPTIPNLHESPEAMVAFDALIEEYGRVGSPRQA